MRTHPKKDHGFRGPPKGVKSKLFKSPLIKMVGDMSLIE